MNFTNKIIAIFFVTFLNYSNAQTQSDFYKDGFKKNESGIYNEAIQQYNKPLVLYTSNV